MEFKPTFFSVSGFLAPGVVLLASCAVLAVGDHYGTAEAALAALPKLPADSGWGILVGTAIAVTLVVAAFVLGTILSEIFIYVGRKLLLRPLSRKWLRENVSRVFAHSTLEKLVQADMDARESYVYMHTCGIDLDWYAGRVRMLGGTGLALVLVAVYSRFLCYGWGISLAIAFVAAAAIAVGLYRSLKFDQYVSAVSAVLARGGGSGAPKKEP